jgi:hypothetical protein
MSDNAESEQGTEGEKPREEDSEGSGSTWCNSVARSARAWERQKGVERMSEVAEGEQGAEGRNPERKIVRAAAAPGATWWLGQLGPESGEGAWTHCGREWAKRRRKLYMAKRIARAAAHV